MAIKTDRLEKFFLMFLFINPFLDIFGGIYIKMSQSYPLPPVSPGLLVRVAVLALFALYILMKKNLRAVAVMVPVAAAWALSVLGELMYYYAINLYEDAQYIVRFAFNMAVILVYAMVFSNSGMHRKELLGYVNRSMVFSANILSLSIILAYIFGVGYSTYDDRFGYRGSRGFFYSGNDITAVLMLLLPLTFCIFFRLGRKSGAKRAVWYAAAPATTLTALLLIGTKAAFLAFGGSVAVMLGYALAMLLFRKNRTFLARFSLVFIAFAVVFTLLTVGSNAGLAADIRRSLKQPGEAFSEGGVAGAVLSGRQHKLAKAFGMLQKTTPYSIMFGTGRGTHTQVIEMDVFEVAIYYGVFGLIAMLWLYFKLGIGFLIKCFKRFDLVGLALLLSVGMGAGYLVLAGHMLFSVTSGFYFALILVYAHLYYAPSPRKLKII